MLITRVDARHTVTPSDKTRELRPSAGKQGDVYYVYTHWWQTASIRDPLAAQLAVYPRSPPGSLLSAEDPSWLLPLNYVN